MRSKLVAAVGTAAILAAALTACTKNTGTSDSKTTVKTEQVGAIATDPKDSAEGGIGETEIDRQPPALFFRQPVGIDTGQRPHQRCLAVIDMAGSREDHDASDES